MKNRTILLIRHPEANKNLADQHGGAGTSLTVNGRAHCKFIASYILSKYQPIINTVLVGHKIVQVQETTDILGHLLCINPIWEERIRGLNLGVLAGLARDEALLRWPASAKRLEKWRNGHIKINELNIPYAELLVEFKNRIESTLNDWVEMFEAKLIIVVCTRSSLIMLVNLLKLSSSFSYDLYKPYDFEAGSITEIQIKNSTPKIISFNNTEYLNDEV